MQRGRDDVTGLADADGSAVLVEHLDENAVVADVIAVPLPAFPGDQVELVNAA